MGGVYNGGLDWQWALLVLRWSVLEWHLWRVGDVLVNDGKRLW